MTENWSEQWPECVEIMAFITYFQNVWFDSPLKYWYEGSALVIVNNNGLESANKTLQNLRIFRRKMPFRDFVTALQNVVENWSTKPEYQEPQQEYRITENQLFAGYKLLKENRILKKRGYRYFIPATGTVFNQRDLDKWVSIFVTGDTDEEGRILGLDSWPQFDEQKNKYHMVTAHGAVVPLVCKHTFKCCTLKIYFNSGVTKSPCKHIVHVKHNKNELRYPAHFANRPLDMNRKTGRPKKNRQDRYAIRPQE